MIQEIRQDYANNKGEIIGVESGEYARLHELTTKEAEEELQRIESYVDKVITESIEDKNYDKLIEMINSKDYRKTLLYSGKYAEVCMVATIHENDGCFLELGNTMSKILILYRELKFSLYRIEFIDSAEEKEKMIDLIREIGYSPISIAMTVRWVSYNVVKVYKELIELFATADMTEYSEEMTKALIAYKTD